MGEQVKGETYALTIPVVMTHPALFVPRAFGKKGKETGEPKYSSNFLFDPANTDLVAMKGLAAKVAKARWPGRALSELKFPFSNGDKVADKRKEKSGKDDGDFNRGKVVIAARSKFQPALSGVENGKVVDYTEDTIAPAKKKFFFGAEVLAEFNFVPYDGVGNNPDGVTAYLNKVFATGKGTRIAGQTSAAETFKGYVGSASVEDPTKAPMDDEIPF